MNNKLISELLEKFETETYLHYKKQDEAIDELIKKYPNNKDFLGVILKVGIINSFYSTNIFKPFAVAKKIFAIKDLDKKLEDGSISVMNEIANVEIAGKKKNFYSFATKYCYHHNHNGYTIYDSYLDNEIWKLIKKDKFIDVRREDLKNYSIYLEVLCTLKKYYSLDKFTNRDIEKALWIKGKEDSFT